MVAASVGKKQLGKGMLVAFGAVVLLVGAIVLIGKTAKNNEHGIDGSTEELRREYLASLGYTLGETSSIADVGVPKTFDDRFTEYNEMLETTGFDLSGMKGDTVTKCTYTVTGSSAGDNAAAVLLIDKHGCIVGGHLLDVAKGKLYPLFEAAEAEEPQAEETILPLENAEQPEDENKAEADIPASAYPSE